jgi:hypothetical protein
MPVASVEESEFAEVDPRKLHEFNDTDLLAVTQGKALRLARAADVVTVRVRPVGSASAIGLQNDLDALTALQRHRQAVDELLQRYPTRLATSRPSRPPDALPGLAGPPAVEVHGRASANDSPAPASCAAVNMVFCKTDKFSFWIYCQKSEKGDATLF